MKMGINLIILCLTALGLHISQTHCQRVINGNMVASVLQDILSPANTQSVLQMLQTAAANAGSNRQIVPEMAVPNVMMNKPIEAAVRTVMPREVVQRGCVARELEQPRIVPNLEVMPAWNDRMPVRVVPNVVSTMPEVMPRQYSSTLAEPCPVLRMASEILPNMNPTLVSPYLPMSSPVSAFAPPASNTLPQPTHARNQYLRKVPIPPPTL